MDQFGTFFQIARVVSPSVYVYVCVHMYIHISFREVILNLGSTWESSGSFLKKNLGPRALTLVEPRLQLSPVLESVQADSSSSIKIQND